MAVFTAKDVPVNEYGLQIKDQPVLCGPGSDKPGADVVRFVGDQMALVVAETEAQARAACKLIRIEWEDLPLVLDPEGPRHRWPAAWSRRIPHGPSRINFIPTARTTSATAIASARAISKRASARPT